MLASILKSIVMLLSTLSFLTAENADQASSKITTTNPNQRFIATVFKYARSSEKLLKVFNLYTDPIQDSINAFISSQEVLNRADVKYPESLAKTLADAVYISSPSITLDVHIYLTTHCIVNFLVSQKLVNFENAESSANDFCTAILKNYPDDDKAVHSYTLFSTLYNGIIDFMIQHDESLLKQLPAFIVSNAKHLLAFSAVSEPYVETSVIYSTKLISAAADVFGISSFSSTFLYAVDSSVALKNIFYTDLSTKDVSKAFQSAAEAYCRSIQCYSVGGNRLEKTFLNTYDYMSKSMYVKSLCNAYALSMMEVGRLTLDNSMYEAQNLATKMENMANNLPLDANLQTRLGVIFKSFNDTLGEGKNIKNLYQSFGINIAMEFYAAVPVKAPAKSY